MKHAGPIAVGGVGGSGTRVVAETLRRAGLYMGGDINPESDTLTFTLLFKFRESLAIDDVTFGRLYDIFRTYLEERSPQRLPSDIRRMLLSAQRAGQHDIPWLEERIQHLEARAAGTADGPWGWKEPNTHIVLERLAKCDEQLRYVHVILHGLDMAVSKNLNQVRLWGGLFDGTTSDDSPRGALRFWCEANKRSLAIAAALGPRHLVVNYDAFCANPSAEAERLLAFAGLERNGLADDFLQSITPSTAGARSKHMPLDIFEPEDLEYLLSLGFQIHG